MMRQTYGVQVGNETYSVVVTDEDWDKRKLERDRQKRLSQETNRRRRALEERKKVAEEREARKRTLQLSKRRQRQTEATERYQRAHLPPKYRNERTKHASGHKKIALDDVLQHLRSGTTENNGKVRSEQTRSPSQPTNHFQIKFETQLEKEQQRIFQEHQLTTHKEFHEISDSSSTSDAYGMPYHNTKIWDTIDHSGSKENILESTAKLFVKNAAKKVPQSSSPIGLNQLRLEDADDIIQNRVAQPIVSEKVSNFTKEKHVTSSNMKESQKNDTPFQDFLHGSSDSSGASSAMPVTSFQRKYADNIDHVQKSKDNLEVQPSPYFSGNMIVSSQSTPKQFVASSQVPTSFRVLSPQNQDSKSSTSTKVSSPATYPTWTHQYVITPPKSYHEVQTQSSPTTSLAANYYIKSFRPSSAVESKIAAHAVDPASFKSRPRSAILERTSSFEATKDKSTPAARQNNKMSKKIETVVNNAIPNSVAKPDSTPFSLLSEAWKKPAQSPPVFTQPKTTTSSQTTGSSFNVFPTKPQSNKSVKSDDVYLGPELEKEILRTTQPSFGLKKTTEVISQKSSVNKTSESNLFTSGSRKNSATLANTKIESDTAEKNNDSDTFSTSEAKFKGILRKISKYDVPMYHTAAVAARQKWVEHITASTTRLSTQSAKLAGTTVRDSLEVNKNECPRPKSVHWHKIHYDDGTSATLSDPKFNAAPSVNAVNRPFRSVAEKSLRNRPAHTGKLKPKPPAVHINKQQKLPTGGKGRKLKIALKAQVPLSPQPPVKPPTSIHTTKGQTISHQSAVSSGGMQTRTHGNDITKHRIAWGNDEKSAVTMENLKSSGSPPNGMDGKMVGDKSAPSQQVVKHTRSPVLNEADHDTSFNLSKTPTDQEINWLWDKVRTCISQRPNNEKIGSSRSDHSIYSQSSGSSQQRASVVSIDGNMFMNDDVQSKTHGRGRVTPNQTHRPSSAAVASAKKRLNTYNASIRRQALLQQRRNKQLDLNRMNKNIGAPRRYPIPKMSYFNPLPSPSARTTSLVEDSTTAFLLAETLAEQNMSESQILKAMESLNKKTREAQKYNSQVNPNAFSIEEQRLLKSLERLNMRLHEVETATATNPNVTLFNHA